MSTESRARWREHANRALRQLPEAVDYQKLSRSAQIDFEILRDELEATLWLMENTHPFAEDPRIYNDYINDSVYLLLAQSTPSIPRLVNQFSKRHGLL